jgi:hypothetical protein
MDRKEHFEKTINGLLLGELGKLKGVENEVEGLLKADGIDIELKAIRIFEAMQKIKFDSEIFRVIREIKVE